MAYSFQMLRDADGSWEKFRLDWMQQCDALEEDFESYAGSSFDVLGDLVKNPVNKTGVFSLKKDDEHLLVCQINCPNLPRYDGPVLRARFLTFSPRLDLSDISPSEYSATLVELLMGVLNLGLSDEEFRARHTKLHLRSPEDAKFFSAIGHGLSEAPVFEAVQTKGLWLYVSLKKPT